VKVATTSTALRGPVDPPRAGPSVPRRSSSPPSRLEAPWLSAPCTRTRHHPSTPRAAVQASVPVTPVAPWSTSSGDVRWLCPRPHVPRPAGETTGRVPVHQHLAPWEKVDSRVPVLQCLGSRIPSVDVAPLSRHRRYSPPDVDGWSEVLSGGSRRQGLQPP
jgi:hypothetical protein